MAYLEPVNNSKPPKQPRQKQPKPAVDKTKATGELAIVALVLGILAFLTAGVSGIAGIIVAGITLIRIRRGTATGKAFALTGLILSVIAIIAAIVAGLLFNSFTTTANDHAKAQAKASATAVAKSSVVADVKATTANVKSYLKKNPDATIDEMINNSHLVNTRVASGETIVIADVSGNQKTGYKNWTVIGTDKILNPNSNYSYQSYSNTYRWLNNTTGASSQITTDSNPRNTGALTPASKK